MNDADEKGLDPLVAQAYTELRKLARHYLSMERPGHTLQPTALVHEAYSKLLEQRLPEWKNKSHFLGIAAQMMRRILVDHARAKHAEKRGGDDERVSLEDLGAEEPIQDEGQISMGDVLAIHEVLEELALKHPAEAQVVELRYFGGLSIEEASEVTGRSPASVKRDWAFARAWMFKKLKAGSDSDARKS